MSNEEKKYFVFYDANAEGEEPFGEYHIDDKTVRPIKEKTPRLTVELNFEHPGEGISLEEAVKQVIVSGRYAGIGTSEDPASIVLTAQQIYQIFYWVEENRERKVSAVETSELTSL